MTKKMQLLIFVLSFIFIIVLASHSILNHRYNFISMIFAFISCLPFYYRYENRKPHLREIVVISIMITLTVASRMIFAFMPGFKPIGAIIIICGLVFGKEAGFLCGSLGMFVSNMFFGQGPWTPFQMFAFGLVGYFAGMINIKNREINKYFISFYGIFAGIFYSLFMDIWTVLSIDQVFNIYRYTVVIISSIPMMILYILSNVIFLWVLTPLLLKRFERIKWKYGFMDRENF